jgi:hypothetical protein
VKTTISLNRKIPAGAPHGGDLLIHCACEVDVDMSHPDLAGQIDRAGELCRVAIEQQIDLERKRNPINRQPGDDPPDDDTRPGDPAYERQQRGQPQPQRQAAPQQDWRDDGRGPDRRRDDREDASARYRQDYPDPAPREERPRQSGGGGSQGAPRNARQFLGWLGKQDERVKDQVKDLLKAWNLPSMMRDWSDDDAVAMYTEVTGGRPRSASHQNGHASSNGNGRRY